MAMFEKLSCCCGREMLPSTLKSNLKIYANLDIANESFASYSNEVFTWNIDRYAFDPLRYTYHLCIESSFFLRVSV